MGGRGSASGIISAKTIKAPIASYGLGSKTVSATNKSPASEKQKEMAKNAINAGTEQLRKNIQTLNNIKKARKEANKEINKDGKKSGFDRTKEERDRAEKIVEKTGKKYGLSKGWKDKYTVENYRNSYIKPIVSNLQKIKKSKDLSSVYNEMSNLIKKR